LPDWQVATALAISLLVGLATHVFYRRPPKPLWPVLPVVFGSALLFSVGDFIANQWANQETIQWAGMVMVYTGLLTIGPGWWLFTRNFAKMSGYSSGPSKIGLYWVVIPNSLLWIGLITNPWHGQFIETHPGARSSFGPLWYCTATINYAVLLTAMAIHARAALRVEDPVTRSQCRFLAGAVAIPISMNMVYVFSPQPLAYDPTSLGFALSCLLFLFAVDRRDLFVLERVSLPAVLAPDEDAILIVTSHHRLLFANPAAHNLFEENSLIPGASIEALFKATSPTFHFPEPAKRGQSIPAEEHRFVFPSGKETWLIIEISPVQQSRGVRAGLCLRLRDQTALRNARHEAERRLTLLEALSRASEEGLLVQEASGEIAYLNGPFARLWNLPIETIRRWEKGLWSKLEYQLAHPLPEPVERLWSDPCAPNDAVERETTDLFLLDGRIFELESFPVTSEGGPRIRAWRLADVTFARAESKAMIQTQKLEGLGVLAGGIAHDFNNLLVAILGNAEIAKEELTPASPAHGPLADVEAAAIRASELTGQLLAYAGKASFTQEDIDLSDLVRDITELVNVSIQKDIQTVFHLAPDLPLVRGGATELRQIIMNLVTNAADAIGDNPGRIVITTGVSEPPPMEYAELTSEHSTPPADAVFLSVRDDGLGMEQSTLDRIFDPFYTTKFTGRGLGLAATRGILESHAGSLRIETAPGVGTSFSVLLPASVRKRDDSQEETGTDSAVAKSRRRILLVEHDGDQRVAASQGLQQAGYTVSTCEDGAEASRSIEQASFDLVILDISGPNDDAIRTHGSLRAMNKTLPILFASKSPEEALAILPAGDPLHDGFVQKPYRDAVLIAQIERLLNNPAATT
jgi:signal transduction histidine kinase